MADGSKWSSSRVANLRAGQQPAQSNGSQQSRWATTGSTNVSNNAGSSASSSSSWRSRPNGPSVSSSSSNRLNEHDQSMKGHGSKAETNNGSSASRWASTSSRPAPPSESSNSASRDTLSGPSSRSAAPTVHVHAPPQISSSSMAPKANTARRDGLQVRSTSRPLGGKSLDRLALLASPSRGLDSTASLSTELSSQGSMDLTSSHVQNELREYISTRIRDKAIPLLSSSSKAPLKVLDSACYLPQEEGKSGVGADAGEEELQQILLLVRKLREALVASKRVDGFAVEVYELSAYLAVLCGDVPQLAATLPRLVLELYPSVPTTSSHKGEGGDDDVGSLATHLQLHNTTEIREEDRRLRVVSLYLLQTLCLSGRATRLGQYTTESGVIEPLHRGLRENPYLRTTLCSLYGERLARHLEMCDAVYTALRDVDPFAYSRLLTGKGGYKVDGWQRLILLQALPVLRGAAWAVARRTYMYLPISSRVEGMIRGQEGQGGEARRTGERERYIGELLLLNTDILPARAEAKDQSTSGTGRREDVPEEWDADEQFSSKLDEIEEENDLRLHAFLTTQFGTTLPSRLLPLKDGHAIKIR